MSGKMRPALLNQVIEEMNIMERQANPALGKAKRDCIRMLAQEKLEQANEIIEGKRRVTLNLPDTFQGGFLNYVCYTDKGETFLGSYRIGQEAIARGARSFDVPTEY